jgi:hypothetical protein
VCLILLLMHSLDPFNECLDCNCLLVILLKVDARVVEGLVKVVCINLAPHVHSHGDGHG